MNRRHEILFRDLEVREVDLWTSFPYQVFDLDTPPQAIVGGLPCDIGDFSSSAAFQLRCDRI